MIDPALHARGWTVALIEAKAENLPAIHGLKQAKLYAELKRLNVSFTNIPTNGKFLIREFVAGLY